MIASSIQRNGTVELTRNDLAMPDCLLTRWTNERVGTIFNPKSASTRATAHAPAVWVQQQVSHHRSSATSKQSIMATVPYEWFTVFNIRPSYFEYEVNNISGDWKVRIDPKTFRSYVQLVRRRDGMTKSIDAVCFISSCIWPMTFRVGVEDEVPYCEDINTVVFFCRADAASKCTFEYSPRALSIHFGFEKRTNFRCPSSDIAFHFEVSTNKWHRKELLAKISDFCDHPTSMVVYVFDFVKWDLIKTRLKWGDDLVKIAESDDLCRPCILLYIDFMYD